MHCSVSKIIFNSPLSHKKNVFTSNQQSNVAAPTNSAMSVRPGERDCEDKGATRSISRAGAKIAILSSCWPSVCLTLPMSPQSLQVISRAGLFVSSGCSENQSCPALLMHTGKGLWLAPSSLPSPAAMAGTCHAYGGHLCSCPKHHG